MKLGVIARSEDRGLGNQTLEVCRHLAPERVLLIDPGIDGRFEQHPERYAEFDTTVMRWEPGYVLDERKARAWLDGLDVVYTAETAYDDRLPAWAADLGCRVVIHANPEQLSPLRAQQMADAAWWCATPWRLEHLPAGTRVVPLPVAERPTSPTAATALRVLHVAGWPTAGDRNGTKLVAEAVRHIRSDCDVIIRGQHRDVRRIRPGAARVTVEHGSVVDYWQLYADADVLLMPRRFGGLCMPAQEAMHAGLAVVMPDCSPNEVWPGPRLPARVSAHVHTPGGALPLHDVDPLEVAALVDELAHAPELVANLQREATAWAAANTWDALRPLWLDELARAT